MKSRKYSFTAHRVDVRIDGFGLHRLITELIRRKIEMRDINYISETEVHFSVNATDYRRLRKIAGRRYRISIVSEGGYMPFLRSLRLRKATLTGLAIFLVIVYYHSLFVSEIRVYGYEGYSEDQIRAVLESVDFSEGSRKLTTKEQMNAVKLHLYNELDNLSWVGIEYDGTLAEVTVVEGNETIAGEIDDTPCNIVADKAGYIARILPEKGLRMFEDGEFVNVGDVVISGVIPLESTTYDDPDTLPKEAYVHASGVVEIYVPHRFTFIITPGIADSIAGNDTESASVRNGESEYDFVKRVADKRIRKYIAENVPEKAKLTDKSLNFTVKGSIIEVSVFIETLEKIGIKQEIVNGSKQPV